MVEHRTQNPKSGSSKQFKTVRENFNSGNTKGGSITVPLTSFFDMFGISCMNTDNFAFYLQNRQIQTSQTGGQLYIDTSPFSILLSDPD